MVRTLSEQVWGRVVAAAVSGLTMAGCIRGGYAFEPFQDDIDETRYGSLAIVVETTGANPDPNGYRVELDESMSTSIPTQGEAGFNSIPTGLYSIRLEDLDPPCAVVSMHPLPFYVFPDTTVVAEFDVDCP